MGYVFISYSSKDQQMADSFRTLLNQNGIETWMAPYDIPPGGSYEDIIVDAMKNCSCFLLILTKAAQDSAWVQREVERAVNFSKTILPVQCENMVLNEFFEFFLSPFQFLNINDFDSDKEKLLKHINHILQDAPEIKDKEKQEILYSQIIELQQGDSIQFCEKICDMIHLLIKQLSDKKDDDSKLNILQQILALYNLYWKNSLKYGDEYKQTAKRIIDTMNLVNRSISTDIVYQKKMLKAAVAIELLHADKLIRNDCIDTLTTGDIQGENDSIYWERIFPYQQVLNCSEYDYDYSEKEREFIDEVNELIKMRSGKDSQKLVTTKQKKENKGHVIDNNYQAIAEYFSKGNNLFSAIEDDEAANDFYKCLLLSYERLKNYCLEVEARKIYSECVIKISELKQHMQHKDVSKSNPSVAEKGIKALLGLTMPKSGMYDVFISYKHCDEDRAHKVYSFLQQNLKEVFFDKESLPEISKSDYEHAIMTALDHSKNFIVLISDLEMLETSDFREGDWVRREMRTFNSEILEGRKKDSKFIILVSDDVGDKIFAENKENIDIMWHWQEIIRFSEFETVLAKSIKYGW